MYSARQVQPYNARALSTSTPASAGALADRRIPVALFSPEEVMDQFFGQDRRREAAEQHAAEAAELRARLAEREQAEAALQAELRAKIAEKELADRRAADLSRSLERSKHHVAALGHEVMSRNQALSDLQARLAEEQHTIKEQAGLLDACLEGSEALAREKEQARLLAQRCQQEMCEYSARFSEFDQAQAQAEQENARLQAQARSAREDARYYADECARVERQNDLLIESAAALKDVAMKSVAEKEAMREELENLRAVVAERVGAAARSPVGVVNVLQVVVQQCEEVPLLRETAVGLTAAGNRLDASRIRAQELVAAGRQPRTDAELQAWTLVADEEAAADRGYKAMFERFRSERTEATTWLTASVMKAARPTHNVEALSLELLRRYTGLNQILSEEFMRSAVRLERANQNARDVAKAIENGSNVEFKVLAKTSSEVGNAQDAFNARLTTVKEASRSLTSLPAAASSAVAPPAPRSLTSSAAAAVDVRPVVEGRSVSAAAADRLEDCVRTGPPAARPASISALSIALGEMRIDDVPPPAARTSKLTEEEIAAFVSAASHAAGPASWGM